MVLLQDETNKWRKRHFIFMQSGASIGGCDPRIQESCGVNSIFFTNYKEYLSDIAQCV